MADAVQQLRPHHKHLKRIEMSENHDLRKRSGEVNSDSKVVSFLYELLRDHLPAATVEELVRNSSVERVHYTNGWLAQYAKDLAIRLQTRDEYSDHSDPPSDLEEAHKGHKVTASMGLVVCHTCNTAIAILSHRETS